MERPSITKQSGQTALKYGVPKLTAQEQDTINKWVDSNYSLYNNVAKEAARKDAEKAVLNRKATVEREARQEKLRKEREEIAAYQGEDLTLQQQKKIATAQNAISDAATIIKQGQQMNGIKVDKSLTDREVVDKFLEVNLDMPYAEYVNRFIDAQVNGKEGYGNEWLVARLGLNEKTKDYERASKADAAMRGYMQGLTDFTQNTIGAGAEWLGSNIAAGIGEGLYAAADVLGADVSEGTVWDKMKKAKGYNREEAQKQASSEDLFMQDVLEEDKGWFEGGRTAGQLTTDIALTAPMEAGLGTYIAATKIPKRGKVGLQLINAAGGGAAFQAVDDFTRGELSSAIDYARNAGYGAATAGLFSVASKLWKGLKGTAGKYGYKLFGPGGQTETAMFKSNPKERESMTNINKAYAGNKNMAKTPYTEMAKDMEKGGKVLYEERVAAGNKLEEVEKGLQYYKGTKGYTAEDVVKDLETEFSKLGGPNAKLPKFKVEGNKLIIDPEGLETLNNITTNRGGGTWKLGDEIQQAWENTFTRLDKPVDATNTRKFIRRLQDILKDEGYNISGGDTVRAMKNALNGVEGSKGIVDKFEDSLSVLSRNSLKNAKKSAEKAIKADEDFKKFIGEFKNGTTAGKAGAAEKALGGKAAQEEIFKKLKKKGIDLNNTILKWAYNMSLYDVKKAEEILSQFYPSKPGMIEVVLKYLFKGARRNVANKMVREGAKAGYKGYSPTSFGKEISRFTEGGTIPAASQQGLSSSEKIYEGFTEEDKEEK